MELKLICKTIIDLQRSTVALLLLISGFLPGLVTAQSFGGCGAVAYIFQGKPTGVYSLDLASGYYNTVMNPVLPGVTLNAVGFDPVNQYLWAADQANAELVRVDAGFNATKHTAAGLPVNNYYVGDINESGVYFLYSNEGGGDFYRVDISSGTPSYLGTFSSAAGNIHDIAFNPVDNQIYTIEKGTNMIKRIDPSTGSVTAIGAPSFLNGVNTAFGAVFFDGSGDFYMSANNNGYIYRVRTVQNLNSGDSVDAIIFAYGPSSGNNDGTKCAAAEVSNEGCANDTNDDDDGDVDCDDAECASNVACIVGGGGGGGLESNDRLVDKIAYRDFWRTRYNVDLENKAFMPRRRRDETYGQPQSTFFRNDFPVQAFIPIDVVPQTETFVSSPQDLSLLSNAVEVVGVDVYAQDRRVGTVLALKTEDGVYEHTKYICDRVKGGKIRNTTYHKLDGEHDFAVTRIVNADGGNELISLFSLYLDNDRNFVLESHWNIDSYPEEKTYYNFHVWANSVKKLELLTTEILRLAAAQAPIVDYHLSEAPEVFINEIFYQNQEVQLVVTNPIGARNLRLDLIKRRTETADAEPLQVDLQLNGNEQDTVSMSTDGVFTLNGRASNELSETADQFYLGGGAWGYFGTENGYAIDRYEVSTGNYDKYGDEAQWIERNIHLKGQLQGELVVFRTLKAGTQPVNYAGYNTLAFEIEGAGDLEVVVSKAGIDKWEDQPRASFKIDGQCREVYLGQLDFAQKDGMFSWEDVKSISFIQRGKNAEAGEFELKISNLAFVNLAERPACGSFNKQYLRAFPNPMSNELNIVLSSRESEPYELVLTDQLGRLLSNQKGTSNFDGKITFRKNDLESGMYLYSLKLDSGTYSGKIVVKK